MVLADVLSEFIALEKIPGKALKRQAEVLFLTFMRVGLTLQKQCSLAVPYTLGGVLGLHVQNVPLLSLLLTSPLRSFIRLGCQRRQKQLCWEPLEATLL
ncbi:hypothetical protein SLE2022_138960 [Rubroshorea leprosula]